MINREKRNQNIIKILLKTVINQERESDENDAKEILPFIDFANALELIEESQCEKMFEDLGNMIEKDIDLDVAVEQFVVAYNI